MKAIIVNSRTITTSKFLENLVDLYTKKKYIFIDQNNYIIVGVEDVYNFRRCHDYFLESICLFFGDHYENPKLPEFPKRVFKRNYSRQKM